MTGCRRGRQCGPVHPLILVGAGGFTRETVQVVHRMQVESQRWDPVWIVDDDPARVESEVAGLTVVGDIPSVSDHPDASVVVPIGNPGNFVARAQIVERLDLGAARHPTLVDPTAVVGSSASLGEGTIVHPGCVLTADVAVGRHVAMMPAVVLTHDDVIGDFVTVASGVRVGGGARIGEGAYLGAGAVIREGVEVGPWSLVGAGAVVVRDIPAGEVWAGNPARRLREVELVGDLADRLGRPDGG